VNEEELGEIRKKKLEEMQNARQQDEQIKATLRVVLDDAAYDRMMNVKIANPSLYMSAVQGCVALYQRLGRKIGNKEVLLILRRLKGEEEETKITFERK
jgi:DNA-binding TFAR19-related protein (PDSD5 family)